MAAAWRQKPEGLETALRANRPEPGTELLASLSLRIEEGRRRSRLYSLSRLSFAGALTILMLGTLGAFGGVGYAASGTKAVVDVVKRAVGRRGPRQSVAAPHRISTCKGSRSATGRVRAGVSRSRSRRMQSRLTWPTETAWPLPRWGGRRRRHTDDRRQLSRRGWITGDAPFTGLALGGTVALSLLLIGTGVALRRRAARDSTGN